jgi:hypothetical protein
LKRPASASKPTLRNWWARFWKNLKLKQNYELL